MDVPEGAEEVVDVFEEEEETGIADVPVVLFRNIGERTKEDWWRD